MTSTCSTSRRPPCRYGCAQGFSLIELLLGLTLALCIGLGLAPVWVHVQEVASVEADDTIWTGQARVATARFERDVRLAGSTGCPFQNASAILQATGSQVVMLVKTAAGSTPVLVEWELVNGSLMRRTEPCPSVRPSSFPHSLYTDSKTMLENIDSPTSSFSCLVDGLGIGLPRSSDLPLVLSIEVVVHENGRAGRPGEGQVAAATVGR